MNQNLLPDEEKSKLMEATIKTVFDLLQQRLTNRIDVLNALENAHMDNIPDKVKEMREVEAGKIRAVMQEQKDIITILNHMFPNVTTDAEVNANKKTKNR